MNENHFEILNGLIGKNYSNLARQSRNSRIHLINNLLAQLRIPQDGWNDLSVENFLHEIASLDSNNFYENVGIGEREGRVFSQIVKKRHFYLTHGIGRSGDIKSFQPKAIGSSIINILTELLALNAIHICGIRSAKSCVVLPLSTGMTLSFCLLYLKKRNSKSQYVIWSRIDQKSCFKSIILTGLTPIVISLKLKEDYLCTDLEAIEQKIKELGAEKIVCVMTTTSTFAPRIPDDVVGVSKLCAQYSVSHLINNAYGLQCNTCCAAVEKACTSGQVDVFVQSTDKNFLVPVGGSIVASKDKRIIEEISSLYAGRASGSPTLDLLITFLQMGVKGLQSLLHDRECLATWFLQQIKCLASEHGLNVLKSYKHNKISFAINLSPLITKDKMHLSHKLSLLGSMLFARRCTGSRVVITSNNDDANLLNFVSSSLLSETYSCTNTFYTCFPTHNSTFASTGSTSIQDDNYTSNFEAQKYGHISCSFLPKKNSDHLINYKNIIEDEKLSTFANIADNGKMNHDKVKIVHESSFGATIKNNANKKKANKDTANHEATSFLKMIDGFAFYNYGAHSDSFPFSYLTVSCSIGVTKEELQLFLKRLDDTLRYFKKKVLSN